MDFIVVDVGASRAHNLFKKLQEFNDKVTISMGVRKRLNSANPG